MIDATDSTREIVGLQGFSDQTPQRKTEMEISRQKVGGERTGKESRQQDWHLPPKLASADLGHLRKPGRTTQAPSAEGQD